MSILFTGQTTSDVGGTLKSTSTTAAADSNYSAEHFYVEGQPDNSQLPFNVIFSPPSTTGEIWLHFRHLTTAVIYHSNFADGQWLQFSDSSGNLVAQIDLTDDEYYAKTTNGTSMATTRPTENVVYTYDLCVTADGTDLTFDVYINGGLNASVTQAYTGDLPTSCLFSHSDMVWTSTSGTEQWYYSEMIVTHNESTLGWRLATLTPNGNSSDTSWTGDYTDILDGDDGSNISSSTHNDRESWTLSNYAGATPTSIRAVVNKFYGQAGTSGISQFAPFVKIGGTDYNSATSAPVPAGLNDVLSTNPDTGVDWTITDLNNLIVGIQGKT